jgi:dTDP-4-amino-4,6-dideoxygalactose transaminase
MELGKALHRLTWLRGVTVSVPFNSPQFFGDPFASVGDSLRDGGAGGGRYGERCEAWLCERIGCAGALLTPSCTAALELAALTLDLRPGDEVVMPSFTFPSLAAAVALRGAVPVFVDVRAATLGVDPTLVEEAVTPRTRAIATLAYGGIDPGLHELSAIARRHGLRVIEDNAHGLCATTHDRPLGSFGDLAALSFHTTKNVQIGEGGALLVNNPELLDRAHVLQDKGTNRRDFVRGRVRHYEWVDVGSSPLLSEVAAALLWSQLLYADEITTRRRAVCGAYRDSFAALADAGVVDVPPLGPRTAPDGHVFCFLTRSGEDRGRAIAALRAAGIEATFHYVPLHSSPAGRRVGRTHGNLAVTDRVASTIVRLPVWPGLPEDVPELAAAAVAGALADAPVR